jgi:hypothetical protein
LDGILATIDLTHDEPRLEDLMTVTKVSVAAVIGATDGGVAVEAAPAHVRLPMAHRRDKIQRLPARPAGYG